MEVVAVVVAEGGEGRVCVGGGSFEEEDGRMEVERVVGEFVEEVEEVSCANEELGRIQDRKRSVEENRSGDGRQWQTFVEHLDSIFLIYSSNERAVKERSFEEKWC